MISVGNAIFVIWNCHDHLRLPTSTGLIVFFDQHKHQPQTPRTRRKRLVAELGKGGLGLLVGRTLGIGQRLPGSLLALVESLGLDFSPLLESVKQLLASVSIRSLYS